jgi:prevent-host-death family protein
MATISRKELRNNVGDVLRRAEAGEELTVTVAGRPVAVLGPAEWRRWVAGAQLGQVWSTPPPRSLAEDLERFLGALADPFDEDLVRLHPA